MNDLESILAQHFQKKFCCLTGSGTTAIYLILKALNLEYKKILYPSITCMTPVNAAIYAGYKPIFCDINLDDYTMDINSLKYMIETNDIGIIVPTHIYGHKCNMDEIIKIAKENNIFILEDAAQTIELSNANASIMSFGHTKILECNNGGGAVFTDDEKLYKKIKKEINSLSKKPKNLEELFDNYRASYYKIMDRRIDENEKNKELFKLQINSKDTFIYHSSNHNEILDKLKDKNKIIENRIQRAKLYNLFLDKEFVDIPKTNQEIVKWRYSFIFKGNREELLKKVRDKNVDISSWYIALPKVYSIQDNKHFINANYLQNHIVNLWITPEYTEEKILNDINMINEIMRGVI